MPRRCERCGVSLAIELIAVRLKTPDGARRLCVPCARHVFDLFDEAQEVAGEMCEALWRAGEADER
jgi:hypothetical protein